MHRPGKFIGIYHQGPPFFSARKQIFLSWAVKKKKNFVAT